MATLQRHRRLRAHEQDRRVLDAAGVEVVCEDCGRRRLWGRERLAALVAEGTTFNELGARLYCAPCRAGGGAGCNVILTPLWRAAAADAGRRG